MTDEVVEVELERFVEARLDASVDDETVNQLLLNTGAKHIVELVAEDVDLRRCRTVEDFLYGGI